MKPQSKKLLFEGILIIVLFVLIAVSFTVAWFAADSETNVNEFVIEVKSSDNFQLSLDGVNFQSSITINLDNKGMQIGDKTMDSSVQLSDLASILTTLTNDQGTATYNQLNMYSPVKDEDTGEPITTLPEGYCWEEAVKSKITKSGDQYYLSSSSISSLAQYLELDIWVRSDSNLSIYLGSDSTIYPVTEVDEDADFIPAMASTTITECGYTKTFYKDKTNDKVYATSFTDDSGYIYLYKDNYVDDVDNLEFLFKTKVQQIENTNTHANENYTFYYTADDVYIVRSKSENIALPIYGTSTGLGQCEAFYGSSSNALFYVKSETNGNYNNKVVYDSTRKLVDPSDYNDFFIEQGQEFINYILMYNFDSYNISTNFITKDLKKDTYYYNELGEVLIHISNNNGTIKYYNSKNDEISEPDKPYKVLKESYYGTEDLEKVDDVFVTKSTKYTFSKNLAAGASLVSFSEIVTDEFNENNKTVQKEVENLKYLWNPLPEMSLVTQGTTSKYVYDNTREETLSYYTYNSTINTYSLNDWDSENSLIKVGKFTTTADSVGVGESPIVETKITSGDKYAVKKMRVKIWLDGNDTMATNSMLNSSTIGNGQVKMCINLVANVNSNSITYEPYYIDIGGVQTLVKGKFLITAQKANKNDTTFNFSVSGTWTNTHGDTIAIANITPVPGTNNQAVLEFYRYGSVIVYAGSNDGRVGSLDITYDYVKLIKIYDDNVPNSYKVIAVSSYCDKSIEDITVADYITTGAWEISDENIATKTVNPDGSLTVNFSAGGEEVISYSAELIETLNSTEYYANNNIRINHTYVVEGGE